MMTRIYRELWEEAAQLQGSPYRTETKKRHFGKITVSHSNDPTTDKDYYTITSAVDLFDNPEQKGALCDEVCASLRSLMKKYGYAQSSKVLAVGLGNDKITADSLGSRVLDKLLVTSHSYSDMGVRSRYGNLCAVKSGVSGITGIESFDLITATVKTVKPDLLVAIDTLSCGKSERLGCTIQLTDNGIEPGAGVRNAKRKLSAESLKVPVIAIGVPFVIYVKTILEEHDVKRFVGDVASLIVTAKDIDFLISDYADVIACAVNGAVHGE